jgi:hypothetical protein
MKKIIEHKYNIGDKHYDFNRNPNEPHSYIFYISAITESNGKVFYELSDTKGTKENLKQNHFGRWLIAEKDIIPNFEKYVTKRKKLLNRLVKYNAEQLLDKWNNERVYKDNVSFYHNETIRLVDKIVPGIFDDMLKHSFQEIPGIKSKDYYRIAKIFTNTTIFFFVTTIILGIILIVITLTN